jgi:predicted RNA-binding protein with PUA-like domain
MLFLYSLWVCRANMLFSTYTSMNYWLMKSEPEDYSIDDLKRDKKAPWYGVRNYQARNFMQSMKQGDTVFFYHSSCDLTGIAGIGKVASNPYPDASQFDKKGKYYEPRATKEKPVWMLVDVAFVSKFKNVLTLTEIRNHKALGSMKLLQKGSRLSVSPVSEKEFNYIMKLVKD